MSYDFDIEKWLNLVVGYFYRKPRILKVAGALLAPVKTLHTQFLEFRASILFKASYSSQQRSLKSLLNRVFDSSRAGRSFDIQTSADLLPNHYAPIGSDESGLVDPLYAGLASEAHVLPLYAGLASEYNQVASFIVFAPIECQPREAEIKSWVNYYRFAGKNFVIKYI